MTWPKWLEHLVKIDLKNAKISAKQLVNLSTHITLNLNIGTKTQVTEDKIVIDYSKLSEQEKRELSLHLKAQFRSGVPVLEAGFKETAEGYIKQIGTSRNQDILLYFSDKIPNKDMPIFKASLYLKSVLDNGGDTTRIKEDIVFRYGDRGRNISNLCSAGYFISWVKPLYEEMASSSDFTINKFYKAYEEIVENYPFAIFVHRGMSDTEVEETIYGKIKIMERYGITTLNIHGIGRNNCDKIRNVIIELEKSLTIEKDIEETSNIIVAKIKIKRVA